MYATQIDIAHLQNLYAGRRVFHGELHDHAATGGTSDGSCPLSLWREDMKYLDMDFAAILDHRQVRHMYLPEWEDGVFLGGTEPGTTILDSKARVPNIHYLMIFEGPKQTEELLEEFPEFEFTGGPEGHFKYPGFTLARFRELIDAVKAKGGFFVHPHPTLVMKSDDPLDYWFADETGIEVFYNQLNGDFTRDCYKLWMELLKAGKRVWATAGCDYHKAAYATALTTIYAEERSNKAYLSHLRQGDMVCGFAGIRMAIGDTKMGGKCSFENQRLVFSVGDFHKEVLRPGHRFRVDLLSDRGQVLRQEIDPAQMSWFAVDVDPQCKYYWVEVVDDSQELRVAIGNPIWNEAQL